MTDSSIYKVEIAQFQDLILQTIKILIRPPSWDFPIGYMIDMLGHVTKTGYKYPVLSHNFQLLAPAHLPYYPRRNIFTHHF